MKGIFIKHKENSSPNIQMEIDWFIDKSSSIVVEYPQHNPSEYDSIYSEVKSLAESGEYDYIIDWYASGFMDKVESLGELGLPYITHSGDCWGRLFLPKYKELIDKHKPSMIMVENKCSIPAFKEYLQNDDIKFIWAPHSFDPESMRDYGEEKIYDITFSGKLSNYDDRRNMGMYLKRKKDIIYKRFSKQTFDNYVRNMNRSWMVISSMQNKGLLYYKNHFIGNCFSRNLEISACNSCLIMRRFGDADELGYVDGKNCILFESLRDFPRKMHYHLDDKESLMRIIQNGYDLVHNNHTIEKHTNDVIKQIREYI